MQLSEQVERVLTYIRNIEALDTPNPWEAGRTFYEKFIPLAGDAWDGLLKFKILCK